MREIVERDELTERQRNLIDGLSAGMPLKLASEAAEYGNVWEAKRFLASQKGALAFHQAMAMRLAVDAPLAFDVLRDIASNRAAPAGARVDAAKALLDRSGWQVPRQSSQNLNTDKALSDMSLAELKATVLELKALPQPEPIDDPEGLFS